MGLSENFFPVHFLYFGIEPSLSQTFASVFAKGPKLIGPAGRCERAKTSLKFHISYPITSLYKFRNGTNLGKKDVFRMLSKRRGEICLFLCTSTLKVQFSTIFHRLNSIRGLNSRTNDWITRLVGDAIGIARKVGDSIPIVPTVCNEEG